MSGVTCPNLGLMTIPLSGKYNLVRRSLKGEPVEDKTQVLTVRTSYALTGFFTL
jgi:hypothetical protein